MTSTDGALESILYTRGSLRLLDQRMLPLQTNFIVIKDCNAGWDAINKMVVRGAPAIAIAAALSLAVEALQCSESFATSELALTYISDRLKFLVSSRPTAVNLADAAEKLKAVVRAAALLFSDPKHVIQAYIEAAEKMLEEDVAANKAIGLFGSTAILEQAKDNQKLRVLTHCNTGSLATAGYGTALGVIRALHSQGRLDTAYCTETRPYNQGSRLTAFELAHDKIPTILIADSAAAALQDSGRVDAIVVGADRIAANGDTANKIGTYSLAVSALHHGIPFYVAAPLSSVDLSISSGKDIVIEERSALELTHSAGGQGTQVAASGVDVWNPAFDVTPAELVSAIITDKGVIRKSDGSKTFHIPGFVNKIGSEAQDHSSVARPQNFCALTEKTLPPYLASISRLSEILGGTCNDWEIREVGDGNLNFVYIIIGPSGSFVLKQAIPYVRCVGESWPMTIERAYFEATALQEFRKHCPDHVPEVYHFDRQMAITAMRYLEPPHIILRKGLIKGIRYPLLAEHMSTYMAKTLFRTSLLAISTSQHKSAVAKFCGNAEMCRLTEQVIFTEPYMVCSNNHWTSPQLDEVAVSIREDEQLKMEIAGLKSKFCERAQALVHGDLHTGSIMVTPTSTQVIDPEFAFYGPMGFDIGAFLANLLLAFFAQEGHVSPTDNREEYKKWILKMTEETWILFEKKIVGIWKEEGDGGDAYAKGVYKRDEMEGIYEGYLRDVFEDTVGFAAAKMIRRIVGIAHVEDLESIQDSNVRAICEKRVVDAAKMMMKKRRQIASIHHLLQLVEQKLVH